MSLLQILVLVLIIAAIGGVGPWWPHSANWGYWPSGLGGVLLIVVLLLIISGRG